LPIVFSPGSAGTKVGCGGKLNGHLMTSCVGNNCTKNYHNLIIGFQVQSKMSGMLFGTQRNYYYYMHYYITYNMIYMCYDYYYICLMWKIISSIHERCPSSKCLAPLTNHTNTNTKIPQNPNKSKRTLIDQTTQRQFGRQNTPAATASTF